MINLMDDFELVLYKELTLNDRINDKQIQLEHLITLMITDNSDLSEVRTLNKQKRKELIKLDKSLK